MWLKPIFLNIHDLIRNKPVLFIFIIISQMICIIAAFTVAGMIDAVTQPPDVKDTRSDWERSFQMDLCNYKDKGQFYGTVFDLKSGKIIYRGKDENVFSQYTSNDYVCYGSELECDLDKMPRYKYVKEKFNRILKATGTHYLSTSIVGYVPTKDYIFKYYSIGGEEAQYYPGLDKNMITFSIEERFKNVDLGIKEGDILKLGDTEYHVSKLFYSKHGYDGTNFTMRSEDIDDSFIVTYMRIKVDDTLTGDELGKISDMIQREFQGLIENFEEPKPKPLIEKQFNNMIYVVSFILMALMMLNLSRIYTYILDKRKNTLCICSLCGGTKAEIFTVLFTEIMLMLILSYITGFFIFRFGVMQMIGIVYPSFLEFFDMRICAIILGSYVIFSGFVMSLCILPAIDKSVNELRRECEL